MIYFTWVIKVNKIKEYLKTINEVSHTTFNPNGPGSIRVHLVPPKKVKLGIPWVIIINGQDILPISCGWAILLKGFIDSVNKRDGKSLKDDEVKAIINEAITNVRKVFPRTERDLLTDDLREIVNTLADIAEGKTPESEIGFMKLQKYGKYMSSPHRMDLMISSMYKNNHWHCNQKCIHCYAGEQEYAIKEELTTEQWKKIIDKVKKARIPQITFTGGEPTLREDLVELIDYSKWFVTRLNTNGVLLTKELCEKLYEASLDSVQVTMYSSNDKIHNLLVGANNFDKTVEGIKNALKANLNVSVNTPLCSINKDYLSLVKYLHQEVGVQYFTCSGLIVTGKAVNDESQNTQLTKEEILEILKEVCKYINENDLDINFTSPGWINEEALKELKLVVPSCGACLSNMAIAPNGDVIPCQSWLSEDSLGNLLNVNWNSVWNNKKCKKIKKQSMKTNNVCPLTNKNIKEEK